MIFSRRFRRYFLQVLLFVPRALCDDSIGRRWECRSPVVTTTELAAFGGGGGGGLRVNRSRAAANLSSTGSFAHRNHVSSLQSGGKTKKKRGTTSTSSAWF